MRKLFELYIFPSVISFYLTRFPHATHSTKLSIVGCQKFREKNFFSIHVYNEKGGDGQIFISFYVFFLNLYLFSTFFLMTRVIYAFVLYTYKIGSVEFDDGELKNGEMTSV